MSQEFSVMDMVNDLDINTEELFQKKLEVKEEVKEEPVDSLKIKPMLNNTEKEEKKPWVPDVSDMPEFNQAPAVYDKDEIKTKGETVFLDNIVDDQMLEVIPDTMDAQTRMHYNIESAKKRFGIKHCQIPPGQFHASITAAAGDTDSKRSKETLDLIFGDIVKNYPEFILEWTDPSKNPHDQRSNITQPEGETAIIELPKDTQTPEIQSQTSSEAPVSKEPIPISQAQEMQESVIKEDTTEDVKIIIDKSNVTNISWSKEEMEKIRRARTVNLNIVEDVTLKYTQIEEADDNIVDSILSKYERKLNDVPGSLPASKYRATFTGLTYTEILDLTHSQEMNNLDGERKKWSIAYDHIKNPSIGDFEDFDDFLKKTSFMDIDYILWKILCASAQEKEIISIDCHGQIHGKPCGNSYDWIYAPSELLLVDQIDNVILGEMKKTSEVQSVEEIQKQYSESMLMTPNTVELPTSKFAVVFGHISAHEYLNNVFSEIHELSQQEDAMMSQALAYSTLPILKYFLLPKNEGEGYIKIEGVHNLIKIVQTFDEIDWQTMGELIKIMLEPYQLKFSLQNIHCPKCKIKSNIDIEDITRLLFIVARSLESVNVTLKRT